MTQTLRPGRPEEAGMRPEQIARARDLCAGWVKDGHTPSLSVCVARRGVIVLHEAFGRLRPEEDAPPLERDSLFAISSVTKPITATLVMQLVEEGVLGLNRPVRDYLPELASEGVDDMLVHHLLTHTTGYLFHSDEPMVQHVLAKLRGGFEFPPCEETQHPLLNELGALFRDAPLAVPPGQEMIYSNLNYELLGEIVRRLRGRALEEVARERVFDPLGMDDTYYVVPESEAHRVMQRPSEAPMAQRESRYFEGIDSRQMQETPYGGAGAFSKPLDMAIFGQTFLNRGSYGEAQILSPASVEAMTRNQIPGIPARLLEQRVPEASWGYGWAVESPMKWKYYHGSLPALGSFNHGGSGGVKLWVDPRREIVGVYFEACMREAAPLEHLWNVDLFENVVTAAASD